MIGVSVAIIAVAFAVLVYYLIQTLKSAKGSLDQVNQTLQQMQNRMDDLGREANALLRNTNQLTMDVKMKMDAVDPLFATAKDLGDAVHNVTSSVKQLSSAVSHTVRQQAQPERPVPASAGKLLRYASVVAGIWQAVKRDRAKV